MSPPERRDPGAGNTGVNVNAAAKRLDVSTVSTPTDESTPKTDLAAYRSLTARRRKWAYSLLRKTRTPVPVYGSEAWFMLEEGSPERVASVVVAAESWATDGDNVADNLERELEERRRLDKAAEDADHVQRAVEHREQYRHLRLVPHPYPTHPKPLEEVGADFMRRQQTVADEMRRRRAGDSDAG